MPPKYASPYSIVKTPLQQTKFYSLFDARNKQTNEVWLLRTIHHQAIEKYDLTEYVNFNQQALLNLKEKEHVVYVNEIFTKNGDTFFIEEKYEMKLSSYLERKKVIEADEIERIIKDVFHGLCDIYEQGYIHRNIRPEHLVFFGGDPTASGMWKIETLVLDNEQHSVQTPFTWKKSTASPEERNQKQQIDEEMLDAQIVWNFGYLAMQLLNGNEFMNKKFTKDSDIQWNKIKELCLKSPPLYELIEKCYRYKFNDRISLRKFFDLQIFSDCGRQSCSEYFLTASKIFKTKTLSSMSINFKSMKSMNLNMKSKALKNMGPPSPKNAGMNKIIKEQVKEEEEGDEISPVRGSFLSGVSKYLNLIEMNEPANKSNENKSIIQFYFIKLSLLFLQRSPKASAVSSRLKDQGNSLISAKYKIIKRINIDNHLLKQFKIDPKVDYSLPEQISNFNKLCGYAYSRLKETCEKGERVETAKALAYFGVAAILVNVNDWTELSKVFQIRRGQSYLEAFENCSPEVLVKLSQELIVKYFKTC